MFILFTCVGCDQLTKLYAVRSLQYEPAKSWLNDTVRIQFAENSGSFLSLGSSLPKEVRFWTFNVFTGVVVFGILIYVLVGRQLYLWDTISYALLVSGGIGNLIDRVFRDGLVVDFMNLGIGTKLRTGIFNVADMAIMAGIFMLLGMRLFVRDGESGESDGTENT